MTTLNLVKLEKSDIKYKISHFPDGQQDIEILEILTVTESIGEIRPIRILSRFNGWKDLELIVASTKLLKRLKFKEIHLEIPYLLGARSDRQFVRNGNSYLVDVIAPIINTQNYETVKVLDVHSDVAQACINNLVTVSNISVVDYGIEHLDIEDYILVSPDAGSLKKIYNVANALSYKDQIIVCSKYRDTDGKLSKTIVPFIDAPDSNFIIIDDICDGGRTFINIAVEIKNNIIDRYEGKGKIYLIVTHGIFSAGFDELRKYFNKIICTNSVKDVKDEELIIQQDIF
jgi:ribose-phosphate pyrophosphokinase